MFLPFEFRSDECHILPVTVFGAVDFIVFCTFFYHHLQRTFKGASSFFNFPLPHFFSLVFAGVTALFGLPLWKTASATSAVGQILFVEILALAKGTYIKHLKRGVGKAVGFVSFFSPFKFSSAVFTIIQIYFAPLLDNYEIMY